VDKPRRSEGRGKVIDIQGEERWKGLFNEMGRGGMDGDEWEGEYEQ
jgi:hypothetical protein